MKKISIFLFIFTSIALSTSLAACSAQQAQVTATSEVTVTSLPPTATIIPTPTLHPQFIEVQEQIAASGETFTLLSDGTIQQTTSKGTIIVPGLSVDKNGAITLQVGGESVTIPPADVSFDDTKGVSVEGYTLDEATGLWRVMETSLTTENLDAKKWGNYSLIENPDGYYEMKDVQGNLIPEVKLFRDGTAELTYSSKKLAVAFQAISVGAEGQLSFGLWDFKNGEWSMAPGYTAEDVRTGEFADDYHKLVVIRGNDEIEKKLTDTIFLARDLYMNNTEGYRPESEFEGITVVTLNGKTIENFDGPAKGWEWRNYSVSYSSYKSSKEGVYSFHPILKNIQVIVDDGSRDSDGRPLQVALGPAYFPVTIINPKYDQEMSVLHVPVVAKEPNKILNLSALVNIDDLSRLNPYLESKEIRGKFDIWIISKTVPQSPSVFISDSVLTDFTAKINQENFFSTVPVPIRNEMPPKYKSLPVECSSAFFTLIVQEWY